MVWGLITFVIGIAYGWLTPGRQSKLGLFMTGLWIGLIVAVAFAVIGYFYHADPLGFGTTFLGLFLAIVVLTLVFVLGAWVGDLIEGQTRRRTA